MSNLIIGGILVPEYASLSIRQTYEEIEHSSLLRLGNGEGVLQSSEWDEVKLRTSIQISGTIPPGLDGINWNDPTGVEISCAAARAIQEDTNIITLPAARRTDVAPWGLALVNGRFVDTTCSIVANVATLGEVTGATAYRVSYYPKITVSGKPSTDVDETGAAYSLSLDAEEL
jgi:hypothetical protein